MKKENINFTPAEVIKSTTVKYQQKNLKPFLKQLEEQIKLEAETGGVRVNIYVPECIRKIVIEVLEASRYKVGTIDHTGADRICITWES
jgi:hypothetical protein